MFDVLSAAVWLAIAVFVVQAVWRARAVAKDLVHLQEVDALRAERGVRAWMVAWSLGGFSVAWPRVALSLCGDALWLVVGGGILPGFHHKLQLSPSDPPIPSPWLAAVRPWPWELTGVEAEERALVLRARSLRRPALGLPSQLTVRLSVTDPKGWKQAIDQVWRAWTEAPAMIELSLAEPWVPADPRLSTELVREIGSEAHPLWGRRALAIARRSDNDDVLFLLPDGPWPCAVVHLTWGDHPERRPDWPSIEFRGTLDEAREMISARLE